LYVGRVSEEKNLDCLVYSFQQLCQIRNDTQLIVVGDGPYLDTLKAKLDGFPAVFTGRQTGEDLQRIYASCDLFAFPSETDTFGVVLMEAQSSGLPVIVSGKSGTRFAMKENVTGRVVRPMTPEGLCGHLNELLSAPSLLAGMSKEARVHAEENTQEKAFETFWNFHLEQFHPHSTSLESAI
jgi:glycosyltransferase involved in cell wall biosynthesis